MKPAAEKNAATRQALADAAKQMRSGEVNEETVKKVQAALDHLFGAGRAFTNKDLEKLSQLNKDDPTVDANADQRAKGPDGRARSELSKGTTAKNSVTKEGEIKQDELGRTTEKGRARIAPEYQKALENYNTRVSQ